MHLVVGGGRDGHTAISLMLPLGKSGNGSRPVAADKSEGIAVGFQQRLQIQTVGAVAKTVVRDLVAHGHYLERVGRTEIGQHHFRTRPDQAGGQQQATQPRLKIPPANRPLTGG